MPSRSSGSLPLKIFATPVTCSRIFTERQNGADGFVSLEVNPTLAHNTEGTLAQAKQLWERVARPNLMVKIPATLEGLPAIRDAIAAGININVTLIFSIERYRAVMDAYLAGLETRIAAGLPVDHIASVASFFVSRMDTKVDGLLPEGSPLRGKTAIAYTKLAYEEFRKSLEVNALHDIRLPAAAFNAHCGLPQVPRILPTLIRFM